MKLARILSPHWHAIRRGNACQKKKKREPILRTVRVMFTHKLRTWHAMACYRTTGLRPSQVLLAHCLRIVYDMVCMTRIVPAWACIATCHMPMHEAFVALFGSALSRLTPRYINSRHHILSFIPRFVVDPTRW